MVQESIDLHRPLDETRGASYLATIKDQLAEERATKVSLEQRGITIVTTSGVLTTLLFGFGAFVYGQSKLHLSNEATGFLVSALVLFVLSAACGLLANQPRSYREADTGALRERVATGEWHKDSPAVAARRDAVMLIKILDSYRHANAGKARRVYAGISLEVLAVVCVAATLVLLLGQSGVDEIGAIAVTGLTLVGLVGLGVGSQRSLSLPQEPPKPAEPAVTLQRIE
jgi:uncharacterized membrane protein YbhN (UPF0104 family)